jgi:hypothetical protein
MIMDAATTFDTSEKAVVDLNTADDAGNLLGVPTGPVTWVNDNDAVATVTVADDTLTAEVVSVAEGTCNVTITDTSSGLTGVLTATVTAGATPGATQLVINASVVPK